MPRGILDTFGLAGAVLFAAPVALFGADLLARGNTGQGLVFLAIAALMVLVPQYVKTPDDVAGEAIEDVAGSLVENEESEE